MLDFVKKNLIFLKKTVDFWDELWPGCVFCDMCDHVWEHKPMDNVLKCLNLLNLVRFFMFSSYSSFNKDQSRNANHANFTNMPFNAKLFEMKLRISDALTHFTKIIFCTVLPVPVIANAVFGSVRRCKWFSTGATLVGIVFNYLDVNAVPCFWEGCFVHYQHN